jgi:hypothetical protein
VRSEGVAIVAAVVLHGAVLVIARSMPPLALLLPADRREWIPIDIEIQPALAAEVRETAPLQPSPDNVDPSHRPPDSDRAPDARLAARAVVSPVGPQGPATAEPNTPQPSPSSTQKSEFDALPPDRPGVLGVPGVPGLNGAQVWSMPGVLPSGVPAAAPAPTVAPAPRPVDSDVAGKVLRDVMATRDKSMGLDLPGGGTVAAAVGNAVRSSDVPNVSRGTFEVRLGPNGQVLSVRVVSMNGGSADQWQRAAQAAAAALAGRGITMTAA